jgi:hypothetical protein
MDPSTRIGIVFGQFGDGFTHILASPRVKLE